MRAILADSEGWRKWCEENPEKCRGGKGEGGAGVKSEKMNVTKIKVLHKELDEQGVPRDHPVRAVIDKPGYTVAVSRDENGKITGAAAYDLGGKRDRESSLTELRSMERGSGAGTQLMAQAAQDSLDAGKQEMNIYNAVPGARPFYEKMGGKKWVDGGPPTSGIISWDRAAMKELADKGGKRAALLDPAYTAGLAVLPQLVWLDWPKQRLLAAGALRAAELLELTPAKLGAALRLMDPRPLVDSDLVILARWAREERDPLERDLAGRSWPILASPAVVRDRQRDLGKKLARIDQRLADRLYAAAVTTMREALKRAGVKAKVRARNRAQAAKDALEVEGMTEAVLAAINVRADELLDRSFEAYGVDARLWIAEANAKRRKTIARSWDLDDDELDDPQEDHRAELAAGILVGLLLGRARGALATTVPGKEPVVQVPFAMVRTAMRVRDGATLVPGPKGIQTIAPRQSPVEALTKQAAERATPLPDLEALARGESVPVDLEGVVPTLVEHFEWVHGYFGEPQTPFEPHLQLDGVTYTEETRGEVLGKDPNEWPEGNYVWSVDDHDSCTCYEIVTWEPAGAGFGD